MKKPVLDKNFYPMIKALEEYDAEVKKSGNTAEVTLIAERNGGYNYVYQYTAFADGCGRTNGISVLRNVWQKPFYGSWAVIKSPFRGAKRFTRA